MLEHLEGKLMPGRTTVQGCRNTLRLHDAHPTVCAHPAEIALIHHGLSHPEGLRYYGRAMALRAMGAHGTVRRHRARRHGNVVGVPLAA